MPQAKPDKPSDAKRKRSPRKSKGGEPSQFYAIAGALLARAALPLALVIALAAGTVVGVFYLRRHVDRLELAGSAPPQVVLAHKPAWMTDKLVRQILDPVQPTAAHSTFDREVLKDTADLLRASPYVKGIHEIRRAFVRRPGDTIIADIDFRTPVALVHWKDYYWLVADDGTKLPEQYTVDQVPRVIVADGKMVFRIIEGVMHAPVESGDRWPGADLAAGLELARTLYGQPFAEEVVRVDVSNFNGRIDQREAQLKLLTRHGTEVRWGRPINSTDYFVEVPAARKLAVMQEIVQQYGRVDANRRWIDIRFDKITYPTDAAPSDEGQARDASHTVAGRNQPSPPNRDANRSTADRGNALPGASGAFGGGVSSSVP